jgi:hypothetical protein
MLVALALTACTALVLVAPAFAGKAAETKVKIKVQSDGFYGYVKSDKEKCANGREVILYKMKGNGQDPSRDKEIGSDTAQANGTKFMWSTGNSGPQKGLFYAYAPKIKGCKAGISKVVEGQKGA